jgi:hypothetical protein
MVILLHRWSPGPQIPDSSPRFHDAPKGSYDIVVVQRQTYEEGAMSIEIAAIVIGGLMMIIPALYGARYERAVWKLIESNPNKALQILRSDTACVVDHAVPWLEKAQYTGPFHINQVKGRTPFSLRAMGLLRFTLR